MAFLITTTVTIGALSDLNGKNYIPNAPIEIRARNTNGSSGALSSIFSDQAGANPITQTGATANSSGQFSFFAEAGPYNAVYNDGVQVVTIPLDVGGAVVSKKVPIPVVEDQLVYDYPSTVVGVTNVLVSSNTLHESAVAYINDTIAKTITLSEGLSSGEIMEWQVNAIPQTPAIEESLPLGSRGNPHIFETLSGFVNSLPFTIFSDDDWIQMNGRTIEADSRYSLYQVTNIAPTIRRNYENYIPLDGDGADIGVTLWAVLIDGFQREFREQPTEIIAHRGFNFLGVEGTLVNYSAAMRFNPDALEGDCQFTSDGKMVLWHDNDLDVLTSGTGEVKNNTLAQVQAATFNELAGTYLQSRIHIDEVEDLVRFGKKHGVRLYIEIKKFRTISDIELLVDLIVAEEYEEMTNLSSFQIADIVEVRRLNKRINVGWLTTNINTAQELIDFDILQKLKWADVLHNDVNLVLFPALVQLVYDAGLGLASWGIQYSSDANALLNVGVTRIITDQPITSNIMRGLNNVNY